MTATATRPAPPRAARVPLRRYVRRVVLALAALVTVLVTLALAGAARDDLAIDDATARATAEVVSAGPRTLVRFTAADGEVYAPDQGVAYPSGLEAGQLVQVEYARDDPELVRVAGRSWVVGLLPAGIVLAVTWLLAAGVSADLGRCVRRLRTVWLRISHP